MWIFNNNYTYHLWIFDMNDKINKFKYELESIKSDLYNWEIFLKKKVRFHLQSMDSPTTAPCFYDPFDIESKVAYFTWNKRKRGWK